MFALVLGGSALACAGGEVADDGGTSGTSGTSTGGKAAGGSGGTAAGGAPTGGGAGFTSGGSNAGGAGKGGSATGGGGSGTGGNATGGSTAGVNNTGGSSAGASGASGSGTGGNATGGSGGGDNTGGSAGGGAAGGASGGTFGGSGGTGGANGGASGSGAGGAAGSSGGTGGVIPPGEPDCDAQMPSGGTLRMNNGSGGQGNLAWEIWSNTGQGQLTSYDVPAFIATWNESGGYLGRLGYEWGGFQGNPVPHDQRGTITAQFVARKTGSAGGYSYIGMYGWTTNPCVEWYVVDDSFNNMPINPGNTTNEGDVEIDGGTYVVYTRPTSGSGGTRCSGVTNWIQYYSVRRTARACGVISLSEHFNAWESLGMDMSGELLEAKILVEVGGGVGNVQLPIANVVLQ